MTLFSRMKALGVVVGMVALLVAGCSNASDLKPQPRVSTKTCEPTVPPFVGERTIKATRPDGSTRLFTVNIPSGLDRNEPSPIVLAFHGLGGTSTSIIELGKLKELSEESHVIVVAPQGTMGEFDKAGWSLSESGFSEDAAFVDQVLNEIDEFACLDTNRVFAMGFSNGSVFAQKYACRPGSKITAVAGISGPLAADSCSSGPVPLIYFHGTSDQVVPFSGGPTSIGDLAGVHESLSTWASLNGCSSNEKVEEFVTHVERSTWADCPEGADVRAYITVGGGHRWPGGYLTEVKDVHGTLETSLNATTRSWRFFEGVAKKREKVNQATS